MPPQQWAALVAAAVLLLGATTGWAQFSPNCIRNGRRDFCAVTPVANATNDKQVVELVTFADHTVYRVLRNEASCRSLGDRIRTCNAKISTPPNQNHPLAAFYRGTAYEGGYQHGYVGKGIHITYVYLD